ncbi:MAG TPA: hypothetical protein VMN76_06205 [Acidobacteriota bacterium]|nr:hypothetical protein [Acidobacteriota bacterium]
MEQIRTTIRINVPYRAHKEGEWWVAYCPSLEVASQGRTKAESKKNLIEAISLFFVSCYERGTLNEALKELGFRPSVARKPVSEKRTGALSFLEVQIPFEVNQRMDYCAV